MKRRWRWLLVFVIVVVMLELTGQSGLFRASTLGGRTITNTPWQLSGSRTSFDGAAEIIVTCAKPSDTCDAMKRSLETKPVAPPITVTISLTASEPPWCYTPFYKSGSLTYEATIDLKSTVAKRIGMHGHVEASGFGIESCGFVRKFLVYLATQDLKRQLNLAANQGRELMWKCADGKLHGNQDERDPCAM